MRKQIVLVALIAGTLGCCPKVTCPPRFNYDQRVKDLEMENAALKAIIEHEARIVAEKEHCVFPDAFSHPGDAYIKSDSDCQIGECNGK
jgi:hypothetical protein